MKTIFKHILVLLSSITITTSSFSQELVKPSDAIALALEHNYGIQIAKNNVEAAANNKNILNSGYLPTITGNAGGNIDRQNAEGQLANGDVRVAEGAETRRYNA